MVCVVPQKKERGMQRSKRSSRLERGQNTEGEPPFPPHPPAPTTRARGGEGAARKCSLGTAMTAGYDPTLSPTHIGDSACAGALEGAALKSVAFDWSEETSITSPRRV